MGFGRWHAQLRGGVIQRARADPPQALLNRMQHGKKQITLRTRQKPVGTGVAIRGSPRSRIAWGRSELFERCIYSRLLLCGCLVRSQMQVHSVLRPFLDANCRRLEFRRSGFGIHGVNGEIVGRNLVVKVHRKEGETRPQTRVKAHRREH